VKNLLTLGLLCFSVSTYAMYAPISISHQYEVITVVNKCPYPITVTFDASQVKSDPDTAYVLELKPKYPGDRSYVVDANETKKMSFCRLVYCNSEAIWVEKTMSTLRAKIDSKNMFPSLSCSLDLDPEPDPDHVKKLVVSHDNDIIAHSE